MSTRFFVLGMSLVGVLFVAPRARAQTIACDCYELGVQPEVVFESTGSGVLTVDPDGGGETLEQAGITLRVRIVCTNGSEDPSRFLPAVGIPGPEMILYTPGVCLPMASSQATDANGWTEFRGPFAAGGCAEQVKMYINGIFVADIPLRLNSPDTGTASPGHVDASDLATIAPHLGRPEAYSICFDYNEDRRIDMSDLAAFAASMGASCPWR